MSFAQTSAPAKAAENLGSNTLKIGVIGPFSGASSDFGMPMLNGIKLAVDEINSLGGYLGRKWEIVVKDDAANLFVQRK